MKKIIKISFLIFVVLVIIIIKYCTDIRQADNALKLYKSSKSGIVIDTIRKKQIFILCKDFSNKKVFEIYPSEKLLKNIRKGDTIYKFANSNFCKIKNGKKSIIIECYPKNLIEIKK